MSDTATKPAGYISARNGKWHRATVAEPMFTRDEASACGMTFRPLNVTWHGERPHTRDAYRCQRPGCRTCDDCGAESGAACLPDCSSNWR